MRRLLALGADLNTFISNLNVAADKFGVDLEVECLEKAGDLTEYGVLKGKGHSVVRYFEMNDPRYRLQTPFTVACGLRPPERGFIEELLKRGEDPNPKGVPQPLLVALGSGNNELIGYAC